jgi:hypothetical protein
MQLNRVAKVSDHRDSACVGDKKSYICACGISFSALLIIIRKSWTTGADRAPALLLRRRWVAARELAAEKRS